MTIHTSIRFAVHPADQSRIKQLDGISNYVGNSIPNPGDTITNPYLVDPRTLQPTPLLVSDVLLDYSPEYVVVVVTRLQ